MNIAEKAALTVIVTGLAAGASSGAAVADTAADSAAVGSPGVASGLDVQVPVDVLLPPTSRVGGGGAGAGGVWSLATVEDLGASLIAVPNPTFGDIAANRRPPGLGVGERARVVCGRSRRSPRPQRQQARGAAPAS